LDVRRIEALKAGGEVIGNRTRVKVVKNKVAPPFREAEFDIMFGQGISKEGDILDLATEENIIQKSGAWFAYDNNRIGQGRENAKAWLDQNPDVVKHIEGIIRAKAAEIDMSMDENSIAESLSVGADGEDDDGFDISVLLDE
jgi:recombination protein RecA